MVRKISFAILSVAILVTGVMAFRKLNYWESSVWIFKLNPPQQYEEGFNQQIVREQDTNEEQGRKQRQERDQKQGRGLGYGRGEGRGRGSGIGDRNFPDSLRWEFAPDIGDRSENIPSDGGFRTRIGRTRGVFRGEKKINLRNVLWYLAVFASFTVAAIYIDKWLRLIRKSKKTDQCQ